MALASESSKNGAGPLHLWAGIECTINRVGDVYFNQCDRSGHEQRLADLERFAELKPERLRYPFLWERAVLQGGDSEEYDWESFDSQTSKLLDLEITPIAGLLHHGSGPSFTHLLDPQFPEKFARYARHFSERYPWIEDYTPINEPLTTARFSALYGFWFPHEKNDTSFVRALYHQIRATQLSMLEIRKVNPNARLIQTDDFGRATGTKCLQYQVDFENHRRWLSFDLLCGKVNKSHPLYKYLRKSGLTVAELDSLRKSPCPPNVIGVNHYLLSNRFLDHRLAQYPEWSHGGNGRHRYADVGGVDSPAAEYISPKDLLREVWNRYKLPIAVTEVHIRGGRESQMRWLSEVWASAQQLRAEKVDVRAVTVWSLLGAFDWNSLCTRNEGFYESGVFDVRSPEPRPTALMTMAKELSTSGKFSHPVLNQLGWWRRIKREQAKPVLIVGNGTLGRAFARICEARSIDFRLLSRTELDVSDLDKVRDTIRALSPWAVVNAAGYVKLDGAEEEEDRCFRENVWVSENLAKTCGERKVQLLSFSSDMVFDGYKASPYRESDSVAPLNVYGLSKVASEKVIQENNPDALIVRTSSFFGPWDDAHFLSQMLRTLAAGKVFRATNDLTISPTYVPDLVHTSLDLLIDREKGIVHLTNEGSVTWAGLAEEAAKMSKLDRGLIHQCAVNELNWKANRPRYSALSTERARILPHYSEALGRYMRELEFNIRPA